MKGNSLIIQSGGPTCVINSSLYGIIKEAKKHPNNIEGIFGALNGIEGLLNNEIIDLRKENEQELIYLLNTPGAVLGTGRHKLNNDYNNEEYNKILSQCEKYNIRYIYIIGGNDSMDTGNKLYQFFTLKHYDCKVIGVPKTIDNDLVNTDHTPGYGSALKYIANTFQEIENDICCYQNGKVTIVEVMGRDAGWLTAGSKLSSINGNGPDLIYLPECPFDIEDFLMKVKNIYEQKHYVLIAISEGIRNKDGQYIHTLINSGNQTTDSFGHINLGGAASVLANIIQSKFNFPVRSIELSLPQRCASHISSLTDIEEAQEVGKHAVIKSLNKDINGSMINITRAQHNDYIIGYQWVSLSSVANKVKTFPKEWIVNNCDIDRGFINYALPLIQENNIIYQENGLPRYAKLKKEKVIL